MYRCSVAYCTSRFVLTLGTFHSEKKQQTKKGNFHCHFHRILPPPPTTTHPPTHTNDKTGQKVKCMNCLFLWCVFFLACLSDIHKSFQFLGKCAWCCDTYWLCFVLRTASSLAAKTRQSSSGSLNWSAHQRMILAGTAWKLSQICERVADVLVFLRKSSQCRWCVAVLLVCLFSYLSIMLFFAHPHAWICGEGGGYLSVSISTYLTPA